MEKSVSFEVQQRSDFDAWCRENRERWASWDKDYTFAKIGMYTPIYVNAQKKQAAKIVELSQELLLLCCLDDADRITSELQQLVGTEALDWLIATAVIRWNKRKIELCKEEASEWLKSIDIHEVIDSIGNYDDLYKYFGPGPNRDHAIFVYGYLLGWGAAHEQ